MADNIAPLRKPVDCPSCKNSSQRETYPFCSKRCADLDLHRWFSQSYAIPGEAVDEALGEQNEEYSDY